MKKSIMIVTATLCATMAFGQTIIAKPPIDSLTGKISYSEDVSVLSVDFITSKEELFSRALSWFKNDIPATTKFAIQIQDKEAGKIVAKALIHYNYGPGSNDPYSRERLQQQHEYIEFAISINVKDGGYKYVLTDFNPLNEKVGSQINDHGFPENLKNQVNEGVDSLKLEVGNYNFSYEVIAATSENRITSLKKAMAEPNPNHR